MTKPKGVHENNLTLPTAEFIQTLSVNYFETLQDLSAAKMKHNVDCELLLRANALNNEVCKRGMIDEEQFTENLHQIKDSYHSLKFSEKDRFKQALKDIQTTSNAVLEDIKRDKSPWPKPYAALFNTLSVQ